MKLHITPGAGIAPTLSSIKRAKRSIDILIFRLDRREVIEALAAAVARGVVVRALIAHTNRGGAKSLRKLEMRLLEVGATVSRTADDLARYHGKMLIVDGRIIHIHGFNFTWLDIEKSRSFGIVSRNRKLLQEATKLFEADCARQPYTPGYARLVVSPESARERLSAFIKAARAQLLIYDPEVSDRAMLRLLADRWKAGVDVRVIGKVRSTALAIPVEKYPGTRLHVRAIIRDGRRAFLGSQSLRTFELEKRREIGVIIDDLKVVIGMREVFEQDWLLTETGRKGSGGEGPNADSEHEVMLQASA